ncbi:MAG: hypothetical protein NC411_06875 [Bacteroides sp.]|nr:hypothetical protein [Bacteroides sp.]
MKKIFTLAAIACMAWSVNAQTESWSVANEDGTLKAEYVPNEDPSKASVVTFSTTNVTGTQVSGPIAGYIDAETIPLEPKVDNTWGKLSTKALSKDNSVAPFYYVQGKGNPVNIDKVGWEAIVNEGDTTGYRAYWNDAYYQPDGTAGLPTNGTYVTLTAKVDGKFKVGVYVLKGNREIFIVKGSDAKALSYGTDAFISGYVNGKNNNEDNGVPETSPLFGYPMYQDSIAVKGTEGTEPYIIGAGNQPAWVYLNFDAAANETYYVFCKSTQVGFSGFEFTPAASSAISSIIADEAADENAPIYNVYGQRVTKEYKGILIQNGKKFINK